ncbi:MAG: hypothetical protein EGQ88_08095 [Prevotellamassilia timonensis]|nr:hypothetical protein [Prevotellamassilia timonensis]
MCRSGLCKCATLNGMLFYMLPQCSKCEKIFGYNSVQLVWVTAHYSASVCGVSALLFLPDIASNRGERLALSFCTTIILHYLCRK